MIQVNVGTVPWQSASQQFRQKKFGKAGYNARHVFSPIMRHASGRDEQIFHARIDGHRPMRIGHAGVLAGRCCGHDRNRAEVQTPSNDGGQKTGLHKAGPAGATRIASLPGRQSDCPTSVSSTKPAAASASGRRQHRQIIVLRGASLLHWQYVRVRPLSVRQERAWRPAS